ncbi:hypothetical protein TDB9533_00304 [Thalassocella blandensis]|nr:hypothetical protein TDB9533_00304 [Thalassocella blandensis]
MRSLAEYIMRGRFQAYSIALLGGLVPMFGQGAIGLVSLRRGWQEGIFVVLWACLPVLIQFWLNQIGELVTYTTMSIMVVTFLSSLTLRLTMNWPYTLVSLLVFAVLGSLLIYGSIDGLVGTLQESIDNAFQNTELAGQPVEQLTGAKLTGMLAFAVSFVSLMGLLLARWLQAILYNPGGFRTEFHTLRLSPPVTAICAIGLAVSYYVGIDYAYWGLLFSLPLFIAGLGVIHNLVDQYKLGYTPLVVMYISFIIIAITVVLVVIIGLTDSWMNYRKIFAKKQ